MTEACGCSADFKCPGHQLIDARAELAALRKTAQVRLGMWSDALRELRKARALLARWRDAMFAHAQPLEQETDAFLARDEARGAPECSCEPTDCPEDGHG